MDIVPIGTAQRTSDEEFRIRLLPEHQEGLHGVQAGDELDVLYWMHNLDGAQRRATKVHPRGDRARPRKGVFGVRSPMRPNPIGVSTVRVVRVDGHDLVVTAFDAADGSPVIDIKSSAKRR